MHWSIVRLIASAASQSARVQTLDVVKTIRIVLPNVSLRVLLLYLYRFFY